MPTDQCWTLTLRPLAVVLAVKFADAVRVTAVQEQSNGTGRVLVEARASEAEFNDLGAQPAE